jgi:hypothetical protein
MIKTKHISIVAFVVALAIPLSFIASSANADKPVVRSLSSSTPPVAPIVLVPDKKPTVLAQNTKPAVKKAVVKKKVVKKKAKKKEKLTLNPSLITPATAPHTPRR